MCCFDNLYIVSHPLKVVSNEKQEGSVKKSTLLRRTYTIGIYSV